MDTFNQKTCPLGFVYDTKTTACVCSSFLKGFDIIKCDIDDTTVNVPLQSLLGTINNSSILGYNEHCPPGYCQQITSINIIHPDIMCRGNYICTAVLHLFQGMNAAYKTIQAMTCVIKYVVKM